MKDVERYQTAFRALSLFYDGMVSDAADAINAKGESLGQTYLGGGDDIVDRYGHVIMLSGQILNALHSAIQKSAGPPPPVSVGVDVLTCPEEELEERLTTWIDGHPDATPTSLQVLPTAEGYRCVILHESVGDEQAD